jgi:hypothetical protein
MLAHAAHITDCNLSYASNLFIVFSSRLSKYQVKNTDSAAVPFKLFSLIKLATSNKGSFIPEYSQSIK